MKGAFISEQRAQRPVAPTRQGKRRETKGLHNTKNGALGAQGILGSKKFKRKSTWYQKTIYNHEQGTKHYRRTWQTNTSRKNEGRNLVPRRNVNTRYLNDQEYRKDKEDWLGGGMETTTGSRTQSLSPHQQEKKNIYTCTERKREGEKR